jgi:hypothetical protein
MQIREVMTTDPITLASSASVTEAARAMREHNVGDVVIRKDGKVCGIVTDRDIVVRVLSEGKDPAKTTLDAICSHHLTYGFTGPGRRRRGKDHEREGHPTASGDEGQPAPWNRLARRSGGAFG